MIDIKFIRENPDKIKDGLIKRGQDVDLNKLLNLDVQRRAKITEVEGLQSKRNQVSAEISILLEQKKSTDQLIEEMKQVAAKIKTLDLEVAEIEQQIAELIDVLPNLPDVDVPPGGKENNEVIRTWEDKPEFDHEISDHVALCENLGLVDYNRGVKLSGANFWAYKGDGALIEWGLLN